MIRAIIQAGFGNQLFQYATAYALSREFGHKLELDISFFDWYNRNHPDTARQSAITLLNIATSGVKVITNSKREKRWKYKTLFSLPFSYLPWYPGGLPIIREDIPNCREDQSKLFKKIGKRGASLFGFWQNTVYFDKYIADLKTQFKPCYQLAPEIKKLQSEILNSESVGVHIRRGDFVNLGWDKGTDYYDKGINWIRSNIENCRFFIFTDDKPWAKGEFSDRQNLTVIDIDTPTCDIDEFFLLSSCRHQIISESTFGWWAAYLNDNPNKMIVIPEDAKGEIFSKKWHKI